MIESLRLMAYRFQAYAHVLTMITHGSSLKGNRNELSLIRLILQLHPGRLLYHEFSYLTFEQQHEHKMPTSLEIGALPYRRELLLLNSCDCGVVFEKRLNL